MDDAEDDAGALWEEDEEDEEDELKAEAKAEEEEGEEEDEDANSAEAAAQRRGGTAAASAAQGASVIRDAANILSDARPNFARFAWCAAASRSGRRRTRVLMKRRF